MVEKLILRERWVEKFSAQTAVPAVGDAIVIDASRAFRFSQSARQAKVALANTSLRARANCM